MVRTLAECKETGVAVQKISIGVKQVRWGILTPAAALPVEVFSILMHCSAKRTEMWDYSQPYST